MCEYQETAEQLGKTEKPSEAWNAISTLHTSLDHAAAIADLIATGAANGATYEDDALAYTVDVIQEKLKSANDAADSLWGAYKGQETTIEILQQQLAETAKGASHA